KTWCVSLKPVVNKYNRMFGMQKPDHLRGIEGPRPTVSILMTAYNRQKYISEAIESVANNSFGDWELIIVDDRSSDNTVAIAESFAKHEGRIKLFVNEKNLGDYPNRNRAASYADGKYIVIVDSDDRMFRDVLIKWIGAMDHYNCSFGIFSHNCKNEPTILEPSEITREHFFNKPLLNFGPVATIIKNDYFKSIGGFTMKYGPANDMYYNLKAASQTNTLVFPFPLVDYRFHDGQELNNKDSYLYNNYLYLRDALEELPLPLSEKEKSFLAKKNKRRFLMNVLKYYSATGDWGKMSSALKNSGFKFKDAVEAVFHF
ncbi:MAG: glycosyltransferase family 2 protein, partial [Ginsengibacter sp.]